MARLIHDLKLAARTLIRTRFVSGLAILAFALGIGITTAVFAIFSGVLLEPLPFPEPHQLVVVYDTQPACATCPASFPKYHDWKSRSRVFAALGGSTEARVTLTGHGDPQRLDGIAATASLSDVFRVSPALGRWFTDEEDRPGGPKVVVLSHGLWTRAFAADPGIVGRPIVLDGTAHEVIGVMPATFTHRNADFFVPLQRVLDPATRGSHFLSTFARLDPHVDLARATTEMRALGRTLAREFGHNHGIDVRSLADTWVGQVRAPLTILLGAVFLVLLIACANVANLLLASGFSRRRELAVRLALGAGWRDLARQLVLECTLLALAGGAIGLALAHWTIRTFVWLAGSQLPRAADIGLDGRVLAFAALVSTTVGVACGLWPLVFMRTRTLVSAVREGEARAGGSSSHRVGNSLVVAEIALAFALLVGSGLLVKNLLLLQQRDAGIRTDRLVAFDLDPGGQRYESPAQVLAFYDDVLARLSRTTGVERVGLTSHLPMYRYGWNGEFSIEGGNPWRANEAPLAEYRWIHGDYFGTLGVPLVRGRLLDARDRAGTKTVLINQAMAETFWPGRDPIGRRFGQGNDTSRWYEVVGIVGNVRSFGLARNTPYEFYQTLEQSPFSSMTVVIRTRAQDPTTIVPTARRVAASVDPLVPLSNVQTLDAVVSRSIGQPRLTSALTGVFGVLAGLLAMVGVYGVTAYNVRRQRREYGIRLALGAHRSGVVRLVIGRGLTLGLTGIALGALGGWLLSGVLRTLLDDVQPTDAGVFALAAALLLSVVLLAAWLPARSASRVDPATVLRDA